MRQREEYGFVYVSKVKKLALPSVRFLFSKIFSGNTEWNYGTVAFELEISLMFCVTSFSTIRAVVLTFCLATERVVCFFQPLHLSLDRSNKYKVDENIQKQDKRPS